MADYSECVKIFSNFYSVYIMEIILGQIPDDISWENKCLEVLKIFLLGYISNLRLNT